MVSIKGYMSFVGMYRSVEIGKRVCVYICIYVYIRLCLEASMWSAKRDPTKTAVLSCLHGGFREGWVLGVCGLSVSRHRVP